jgi:PucR family transcriptional regulator, purine catabolism regulatory protein
MAAAGRLPAMTLSVEAALELEIFTRTPFRVFAGRENLHREIRWVHPVEVPDIARFLTGGEMLLTAGLGLGSSPAQQRKYMREINAAGAAVLVIELSGRAFHTMPQAVIEEAECLQFPLVGLESEIPFVEVSAQVHEVLVDARVAELTAFDRLNQTFMQLLLDSRDQMSFTEALAHEVGWPVILEDINHDIIAYAGGTADSDATLKNWGLHARVAHGATHLTPSVSEGCIRRPVVLRGERWGWLHVMHGTAQLSTAGGYALDRAAISIAITLLSDRESGARIAQRQNSLINRLLLGDISGEQFVSGALRIGRDLRERPLVVIFLCKDPASTSRTEQALESLLRPIRVPAVIADVGDHLMAVCGLPRQLSEQQLMDHLGASRIWAGISRVGSPADLPNAVHQARSAASVAATKSEAAVLRFDELGVLRLLVSLARGPELASYVDDELGALLAHDAATPHPLMPTLRAYLESDGKKSRAAEALFVQRRTLYYRIGRLEALLGKSLDDPHVRQALGLAVSAFDLLQSGTDG